eukprot:3724356-Prymnesium_polylepis.1
MQICDDDSPRWPDRQLRAKDYMTLDAAAARPLAPQQNERSARHRRIAARGQAFSALLCSMNLLTCQVLSFGLRLLRRARARIAEREFLAAERERQEALGAAQREQQAAERVQQEILQQVTSHPLSALFVLTLRARAAARA